MAGKSSEFKGSHRLHYIILRFLLLILTSSVGYFLGWRFPADLPHANYLGTVLGFFGGLVIIGLEVGLRKLSAKVLIGGILGLLAGLLTANVATSSLLLIPFHHPVLGETVRMLINAVFAYLGIMIGVRKGEEFELSTYRQFFKGEPEKEGHKILDTSVIIDGRIADICETGFLEGELIIPQFILKELQHIADSSDPLKRNRGRRGLDILQRIQKNNDLEVRFVENDFPKIREVDAKLIELAKAMGAKVITNDFNLNKVAELQGVTVLNINQLANAVKPVVLPGEIMKVYVLKEGKEYGQGVAYLDDGTMVVVDGARKFLGRNVEVSVTSVLQTTAGRMIFTKLRENGSKEE
ncbi:MAG: TRAM domain-containing protein [Candidatus Tectomicrobia bacterium]|uniref:TRAM domain-containing protein n=1 Tax=Tectimicrobiota bacterium TaxID=2528274 RepID=A0A932GRC5_UNCTE|nr:TRAM domain-containing protein [Candidatus Tectomicrobia bacterium]